jgi:cytidylate kinase
MSVAISREAGARGGTLAASLGQRLNWPVFDQDTLDHLVRDELARRNLLSEIPPGAHQWAEATLKTITGKKALGTADGTMETARLLLTIAARGQCILVGRGAGFILPKQSTIHIRVVAPLEDRVAYIGQWLRLSRAEAQAELATRDEKRIQYLLGFLGHMPNDLTDYDFILNSSRLGMDLCTNLVLETLQAKLRMESQSPESVEPA